MRVDTKYDIGETVYLKTDPEQKQRMIVRIVINPNNNFEYLVRCGIEECYCFEVEFTKEKDILKSIE